MKNQKSYCIIKEMTIKSKKLNVILLDSNHEVLEFEDKVKADDFASIMNENSDSGWNYVVKEI